ncbi:uncharacterized protein LACBIDRAFT_332184 [Laccaria bicolor S238N-H82]|uniref:Predicted protein n=1 Tax=Laccaria bicolor (strain S238N-H82 / ATCC MYA-4686) TaxID=486041 RepID=B0DRV4_LACBS|nr:uncharacterized protein LACBIDRAFT_332184 [Laccaria bicolor S238N-H82]EDR02678.1 predicted protein [Laccaria bicolor S238N-H82]|eukprot:XP_001886722.1 predicted protein [Laccaria bicolor S238N-H82]
MSTIFIGQISIRTSAQASPSHTNSYPENRLRHFAKIAKFLSGQTYGISKNFSSRIGMHCGLSGFSAYHLSLHRFLPKKQNKKPILRPCAPESRSHITLDMAALAQLVDYVAAERLATRYLPFCDSIFLCLTHQLAINIDPYGCHIVETIRGWLMVFGFALSEGANSLRFTLSDVPNGCFLTSANRIVYLDYVVLMIYEAVILVLMMIPGIASWIIMYIYLFVNVVVLCALSLFLSTFMFCLYVRND